MRRFAPIGLFVLLSGAVLGQAVETLPTFEFADVHENPRAVTILTQGMRGGLLRAGGRYELTSATMVDLIRTAYGVDADKVLGGPSWLESDRFDIIAKAPPKATPESVKFMLQALLADRFKLGLHKDTHPMPTYALSVGKGGPKLKETEGQGDSGCTMTIQQINPAQAAANRAAVQNGGPLVLNLATFLYTCHNMTMAAFAEQMRTMIVAQSYIGNNPTMDQTGLKGAWDFDFKYTQKPPNSTVSVNTANGPQPVTVSGQSITLSDALEKQLGLKLDPVTAPIPVIIVDSVNRKPTDNPPGVVAKLPPPPATEFDVAEIRLTAPGAPAGTPSRGFQPSGQVDLRNYPLKSLIALGWDLNPQAELAGAPKWLDSAKIDLIAKLPVNGRPTQGIDVDTLRPAIRALLIDRFKVVLHTEMRPGSAWALTAPKPKLAKADPVNRTLCKEGPGLDGKDPRVANPVLGRLLTCQNMTMAQFAEQLPIRASGYFRLGEPLVDATGLTDAYDFTLSFSGAGLVPGAAVAGVVQAAGGGRSGDTGPISTGAFGASDPNGALSLFDALTKQLGLKLEQQKRPVPTVVLDHIEEKPTD
jgi:uncharacterized protein (TIGR03435 family)